MKIVSLKLIKHCCIKCLIKLPATGTLVLDRVEEEEGAVLAGARLLHLRRLLLSPALIRAGVGADFLLRPRLDPELDLKPATNATAGNRWLSAQRISFY